MEGNEASLVSAKVMLKVVDQEKFFRLIGCALMEYSIPCCFKVAGRFMKEVGNPVTVDSGPCTRGLFVLFRNQAPVRNLKKNSQSLTNVPGYNPVNMTQSTYKLFKETNGKIATRTFSYSENTPYLSAIKYGLSDAVYSNAAYARLKNVSLVYNFDSKWISKVKLTAAQIYVRAQNLLTVTHFDGYDPETGAAGIPPLRTITGGFKLTF